VFILPVLEDVLSGKQEIALLILAR